MLHKQFFPFHCNGCSIGPLTDYANNSVFQELPKKVSYFLVVTKEYIDLRDGKGYKGELKRQEEMVINFSFSSSLKFLLLKI